MPVPSAFLSEDTKECIARAPVEGEDIKDATQCPYYRFPFAAKKAKKPDKLKPPEKEEAGYNADEDGSETESNCKISSDKSSVKRKAKSKAKAKQQVNKIWNTGSTAAVE